MSEEKNKPAITVRDRLMSVSVFKKEIIDTKGDGKLHTFYSACLQRSFQAKDSQDWKREQINLYPDELLKLSALCLRAYNELTAFVQSQKSNNVNERQDSPGTIFRSAGTQRRYSVLIIKCIRAITMLGRDLFNH